MSIIVLSGCESADTYTLESFDNGGFVKFTSAPEFRIGTDPTIAVFEASVEDPTGNVAQYDLYVRGTFTGAPADPILYKTTLELPIDVGFNMDDLATVFGVDASVFAENNDFFFTGTVTTTDGRVYDETEPEFDGDTGEYNGGLTDAVLLNAAGLLNALDYRVRLRAPQ